MLGKGIQGLTADTVCMPVGIDKVYPFLAAVTACRAVKEGIGTGIGLVEERDEIILHSGLLVHVKPELPIHGFQLVACLVHMTILLQFGPAVKGIPGNFLRICLIGFGGSKGIITEASDQRGIHGADEDAGIREPGGNRLIIPPGVFHADLCIAVQSSDNLDQRTYAGLSMPEITGLENDLLSRLKDCHSALALGNINTNCVHGNHSFKI